LILENARGQLVGIEVKAAATGAAFKQGIIFYTGNPIVPFGKHLHAVPQRLVGISRKAKGNKVISNVYYLLYLSALRAQ
jgi:hypothetical protein